MNDEIWLKLARRLNVVLASPETDGVLITHGTDTLEETSYFLSLVTRSDKPVVMVGSIVVAGVGDGNMTTGALDTLAKAAKNGIAVVRSTRLATGLVLRNNEVNDDTMGFVASEEFNPAKSRVLLQLALTRTKDPVRIQKMFW